MGVTLMTTAVRKGAGAAGLLLRGFVRAFSSGCYRKKRFYPPRRWSLGRRDNRVWQTRGSPRPLVARVGAVAGSGIGTTGSSRNYSCRRKKIDLFRHRHHRMKPELLLQLIFSKGGSTGRGWRSLEKGTGTGMRRGEKESRAEEESEMGRRASGGICGFLFYYYYYGRRDIFSRRTKKMSSGI